MSGDLLKKRDSGSSVPCMDPLKLLLLPGIIEQNNLDDTTEAIVAPERLKPKGSSQPFQQNKQLESIISEAY